MARRGISAWLLIAGASITACDVASSIGDRVAEEDAVTVIRAYGAELSGVRAANPAAFAWRDPPYEYEHEKLPFDILAGSAETREQIERGVPAEEIARSWEPEVAAFAKVRERFLLY